MSQSIKEAEEALGACQHAAEECRAALDTVTVTLDAARAEEARLDALPMLGQGDLLAQENTRRYLRTLTTETLPEAEAAHAAAQTALAEAERALAHAHMLAAQEELGPLAESLLRDLAKGTEKHRPKLAGLRERVKAMRSCAADAGEDPPPMPSEACHLAQVDPTASDGPLLVALGNALVEMEAAERRYQESLRREAERARAARKAEQERAAFEALPEAQKVEAFDAAVEAFRASFPGYRLDYARQLVATGSLNPYGPHSGVNPHAPPAPPVVDAVEDYGCADRAGITGRLVGGDHDPFASR